MRTRFLPFGAAMALALGLLTAAPASASYTVESITFPGGYSEYHSSFSGPASIRFTFDGSENDATFSVRIRPARNAAVHTENVFVDADDPNGPFDVRVLHHGDRQREWHHLVPRRHGQDHAQLPQELLIRRHSNGPAPTIR
jgi:hypothetical protein